MTLCLWSYSIVRITLTELCLKRNKGGKKIVCVCVCACVGARACGWVYNSKVNHKILKYMQLRSDQEYMCRFYEKGFM